MFQSPLARSDACDRPSGLSLSPQADHVAGPGPLGRGAILVAFVSRGRSRSDALRAPLRRPWVRIPRVSRLGEIRAQPDASCRRWSFACTAGRRGGRFVLFLHVLPIIKSLYDRIKSCRCVLQTRTRFRDGSTARLPREALRLRRVPHGGPAVLRPRRRGQEPPHRHLPIQ